MNPDADTVGAGILSELRHRIVKLNREIREMAAVAAAATGSRSSGEMPPEMSRQLRALGYLN